MKANEVDILIIPGGSDSDADHWQSRWEAKLSTAKRVIQKEGHGAAAWVEAIVKAAHSCRKPVILVAHCLGVAAAIQVVPQLKDKICGGFFVSPSNSDNPAFKPKQAVQFGSYPTEPLPFPSIVISARNAPFGSFAAAEKLAENWHSLFLDAGESGHIDSKSGHGPWPEGLMVFSQFLANLPNPNTADDVNSG